MKEKEKSYASFGSGQRVRTWQGILIGLLIIGIAAIAGRFSINSIKTYNEKTVILLRQLEQ